MQNGILMVAELLDAISSGTLILLNLLPTGIIISDPTESPVGSNCPQKATTNYLI